MRLQTAGFIGVLSALLGVAPLVSAQQPGKVPYIGYMSPGDIPRYDNAFLQILQEEGYILPGEIPRYDDASWRDLVKRGSFEGQKIRIEIRSTVERYPERAPDVAAELVRMNVDALFASTPPEALAARQAVERANKSIPVIFGPQYDPVGSGLVVSLARPGGDVTGLVLSDPELDAKRLEVLADTIPRLASVIYLHEPMFQPPALSLRAKQAVQAAARAMRIRLEIAEIRSAEEVDSVLALINRSRPDAILVQTGPLILTARHRIVEFAAKRRLPAMYGEALFVEAGGLMFYGTPYAEWYGHSAAIVAKVLKGTKPADIPVEQPTEFKLLINSKTAKTMGITIPQEILLRAEIVDTLER